MAFALALILPLALVACGNDDGESVGITDQDREQFEREVRDRLQEAERELDNLRERIPQGSGDEEVRRRITEAEERAEDLREQLRELEEASDEEFQRRREETRRMMDNLQSELQELRSRLDR
jgi:DNA repair exonuclease SbcCD ATPase subunit